MWTSVWTLKIDSETKEVISESRVNSTGNNFNNFSDYNTLIIYNTNSSENILQMLLEYPLWTNNQNDTSRWLRRKQPTTETKGPKLRQSTACVSLLRRKVCLTKSHKILTFNMICCPISEAKKLWIFLNYYYMFFFKQRDTIGYMWGLLSMTAGI
jgi:hypothetical protein